MSLLAPTASDHEFGDKKGVLLWGVHSALWWSTGECDLFSVVCSVEMALSVRGRRCACVSHVWRESGLTTFSIVLFVTVVVVWRPSHGH